VKWYNVLDSPGDGWLGWTPGRDHGVIWLRSDLAGLKLLETVCHEVSHVARARRGLDNSEAEAEADTAVLVARYCQRS
jgi:hypothetical protein